MARGDWSSDDDKGQLEDVEKLRLLARAVVLQRRRALLVNLSRCNSVAECSVMLEESFGIEPELALAIMSLQVGDLFLESP